jgi:hypothetical protein
MAGTACRQSFGGTKPLAALLSGFQDEVADAVSSKDKGAASSSSSSSNLSAQQAVTAFAAAARGCQERQQLQRGLESMLNSCRKACAAAVLRFNEQALQPSPLIDMMMRAGAGLIPDIRKLAVLARVSCDLWTLLAQPCRQQWQQPAAEPGVVGSRSSSSAGAARQFVVLAAKSLLHISSWLQQRPGEGLITAPLQSLGGPKDHKRPNAPSVIALFSWGGMDLQQLMDSYDTTTQLQQVLHGCIYSTNWLLQQLSVAGVAGQDGQQAAAAQKAQQQLLQEGTVVLQAMQGMQAQLQLLGSSCLDASKVDGDAGGNQQQQQWEEPGLQLDECWQLLHSFAAGVIDECPVSSSCCNPHCVNMGKLSEWQLVSGKGCVCEGCGVARYCSKACQVKVWAKHHRQVCRRLRAPAADA